MQPTYLGTLVEVNEHHTVIDFDEHGRRVLDAPRRPPGEQRAGTRQGARKRATKAKKPRLQPSSIRRGQTPV
jgi:hypothetical protein